MPDTEWNARRILGELCDADLRKRILISFWKKADDTSRSLAAMQLAKSLRFRDETIRKAPAEKKAEWLASRLHSPEFEDHFERGLMAYHTTEANELLSAFLDHCGVPHTNGVIENEEYAVPSQDQVKAAAAELAGKFPVREVLVYLASAGLLMGDAWRDATWPVIETVKKQHAAALSVPVRPTDSPAGSTLLI